MKRLSTRFLLIVYISCMLSGCTININIDNPSENTANTTDDKTIFDSVFNNGIFQNPTYESRATIYISNKGFAELPASSSAISSSDLSASKSLTETYAVILNTKRIKSKIQEEYPNIEYELTLEPINETEVFDIIATSENSEKLEEVCNLAASLLCEEVPLIIEGSSCKVVDNATPAQLAGTK